MADEGPLLKDQKPAEEELYAHVFSSVGRILGVVSIVVALGASAGPLEWSGGLPGGKENPFAKIVRSIKRVIGSLGDGLVTPRP